MLKRLILVVALVAFTAVAAQAASHIEGTIQVVKADTLVVKADFVKVSWVKDGAKVKLNKKINGVILSVSKDDSLLTILASKVDKKKFKPEKEITIKKYTQVMTGC